MSKTDSLDPFGRYPEWLIIPSESAFEVTPNDSADLTAVTRGVYIGGAGDLAVTMKDGSEVTFVGLQAGLVYPYRVRRIKATGTTATDIVGIY